MIIVKITDGLGNQMFQYAYAKSRQILLHQKVYMDISDINQSKNAALRDGYKLHGKREYQLNHFRITLPVIDAEKVPEKKQNNEKNRFLRYCGELRLLPTLFLKEGNCREEGMRFHRFQNYYLEGWFFDKSYYGEIEPVLRREFQLKDSLRIPDEIKKMIENRNTVSVHIRRGDFLRIGRNISEGEYYKKALGYVQERIENPALLVFSDDTAWVKSHMHFEPDYILVSEYGLADYEELILMSMCKHNIMANSTFSYWGAWLNPNKDKMVVVPRGWREKIIPDTWVRL